MRLYKITASIENSVDGNGPSQNLTKYVGSKAEAVAARKAFAEQGAKRKDLSETEVDVPTDKAGLIEFLDALAK